MKLSSASGAPYGLLLAVITALVSYVVTGCAPVSAMNTRPAPGAELQAAEPPLSANALHFDLRLPPLHCSPPPIEMSAGGQQQFVQTALTCLEGIWVPALRTVGMTPEPIELAVVDEPISGCGKQIGPADAAFYCAGTVYWPVDNAVHQGWGSILDQYLLFVVMHEYGHHLQSATGILRRADGQIIGAGVESPLGLELSRRIEMQAQCLAGVMLASAESGGVVRPESAHELIEMQADVEEDPMHGSGGNGRRWAAAGYRSASTSACDTWSAAPSEVN